MSRVRLSLLGAPRLEHQGRDAELTTAKALALLGYLSGGPSPHLRERVLALLWPESPPDAARKNLRNMLWAIRKALGEDAIVGEEQHIELADDVWVDVRELEKASDLINREEATAPPHLADQLQAAFDLYRGPFLDGLQLEQAPDYEIWLTGERERLAQIYLRVVSRLVSAHEARGDWRAVIAVAERALEQDNLQEPLYRALMEAHARLGDRAQALHRYDTLRATLARELGVEPLAETDALRTAIMDGAFDEPAYPARAFTARRERATVASPREHLPFVGRAAELATLESEWQTAVAGHARVVLIAGELGIGKSRLWQEWSEGRGSNVLVLETRSLESTQSLPLAPLAELFRNDAVTPCLTSSHSPLSPVWLAEVSRLLPEIHTLVPNLPPVPTGLPPEEERHRLFEAFTQVLLATGEKPLALFLDDLQWADPTTLDWLDYFVHRVKDRPVLVVATLRPEDATAPLVRLSARWARDGLARRITLSRLTEDESIALAAALGVDPTIARRVQVQSAGNPYFLIELIRALPSDNVPPVLAELLRARLDRLPETAHQVVQAAAVLEPDFDIATLRRTSGRGEEETLDSLDTLLGAGVLEERAGTYAFSHPLVSEVVRGELSGARRAFLHHRAGQALELTYAGRLAPVAGRIAAHYSQDGDASRAARFAEMAAEHALTVAAPAEAVAFYRRALELEPTPTRQLGLGQALLRQGDIVEARAALEDALRGFAAGGDGLRAGRTGLRIAETFYASARFEEGREWIEKSLNYLDQANDPESHALAHLLLGSSRVSPDAEGELRQAARHAEEGDLFDIGARTHFVLGNMLAERGDLKAAIESFSLSLKLAEKAGDDFQQSLALNNLAYHSLLAGDVAAARRYVDEGLTLSEQRALRLPLQNLYSTRGEIALAEGKWEEAESYFERAYTEAERNANARDMTNARANLALAARGRGDLDLALVLMESARESAEKLTDQHLQIKIELMLAELYIQRGERTAAKEALGRAQVGLKRGKRRLLQEWADRLRKQL